MDNPYYQMWMVWFETFLYPDLLKIWGPFALFSAFIGLVSLYLRRVGIGRRANFWHEMRNVREYIISSEMSSGYAETHGVSPEEWRRINERNKRRRARVMRRARRK